MDSRQQNSVAKIVARKFLILTMPHFYARSARLRTSMLRLLGKRMDGSEGEPLKAHLQMLAHEQLTKADAGYRPCDVINVTNAALMHIFGTGEQPFMFNEYLPDGRLTVDYPTLWDYDYADYLFQCEARRREGLPCGPGPYRGTLCATWGRGEDSEGRFAYLFLYTLAHYVSLNFLDPIGEALIANKLPHHLEPGTHHGEPSVKGVRFDMRRVMDNPKPRGWRHHPSEQTEVGTVKGPKRREAALEALLHAKDEWVANTRRELEAQWDKSPPGSWLVPLRGDRPEDTEMALVFTNVTALRRVRTAHLFSDTRAMERTRYELVDVIRDKVRGLAAFIGREHERLFPPQEREMEDVPTPKVVDFKPPRGKVFVAPRLWDDL